MGAQGSVRKDDNYVRSSLRCYYFENPDRILPRETDNSVFRKSEKTGTEQINRQSAVAFWVDLFQCCIANQLIPFHVGKAKD